MDIDKLTPILPRAMISAGFGSLMDIDKLTLTRRLISTACRFGSLMDIDKLTRILSGMGNC